MKRSAPIAFFAKLEHPAQARKKGERATREACAERVLQALRKAHPRLTWVDYVKHSDEQGDHLWIEVEDEDAVFTKRELNQIANAVCAVEPEICVFLWIQDDEEHEYRKMVLLDEISEDPYSD